MYLWKNICAKILWAVWGYIYVTFFSPGGIKNLGKYYIYKFLTVYAGHWAVQVRPERDSGRS